MNATAAAVMLVLVALAGWIAPAVAMRALVPSLESGPHLVTNYRGRKVAPVLGVAWLVWSLAMLLLQTVVDIAIERGWQIPGAAGLVDRIGTTPLALPFYVVPLILVAACVALGLVDDAFGTGGPKGFRGHLSALGRGRLTTGTVKMLGIGVLAVFYGATAASNVLERSDPSGMSLAAKAGEGRHLVAWALAALVIALSANLLNLLDVRPGRSLKAYIVLVPAPAVAFALATVAAYNADAASYAAEIAGLVMQPWESAVVAGGLVVVLLGPALAVWSADLGERAMLGDAGANTMGAIIGYLLTAVLDLAGLAIAAVVLLALNLLSERVSFSAVIERVPLLSFLDRLGRPAATLEVPKEAAEAAPQPPAVLYHSDEDPVTKED